MGLEAGVMMMVEVMIGRRVVEQVEVVMVMMTEMMLLVLQRHSLGQAGSLERLFLSLSCASLG